MKHILASLFDVAKAAILLVVLGFGAATLSAQSSWTPAPANPPANNAAAPINISSLMQRKLGPLFLGTTAVLPSPPNPITSTFDVLGLASTTMLSTDTLLVSKAVTFAAGSPMKRLLFGTTGLSLIDGTQGTGKVLTSDATGRATWQTLPAATGGTTPAPAGTCDTTPFRASSDFARNTVYQNTSGTQLIVMATGGQSQTGGGLFLEGYIGSTEANLTRVSFYQFQSTNVASITFLVPPGYYYKVVNDSANSPTLNAQAWKVCGGSGSTSTSAAAPANTTILGPLTYDAPSAATDTSKTSSFTLAAQADVLIISYVNICYAAVQNVFMTVDGVQVAKTAVRGESNGADCGGVTLTSKQNLAAGAHTVRIHGSGAGLLFTSYPSYGDTTRPVDTYVYIFGGISGGAAGAVASWVDVPINENTSSFDVSCEYRFKSSVQSTGGYGTDAFYYVNGVLPENLIYISHSSATSHIPKTDKDGYYVNGSYVDTITKIEKRCGGSGGTTTTAAPAAGVAKIIAGSGISISPTSGTGDVTVTATGGVSGGVGNVCGAAVRRGTMTQFNTVSPSTDSWGCAVDPTGSGFNGGSDTNDSYRRTLLNNGTCTNSRKIVVDALERSFICVKEGSIGDSPGAWCGSYNYSRTGGNPRIIAGANIVCKASASACPAGYSEFPYVSQGAGTPANPESGKLTCIKD